MVLSGVLTGLRAMVVPVQEGWSNSLRPGEIYLKPRDGATGFYAFNQRRDIAQRLPGLCRPDWFPPFSLRDAADLHDEILRFCLRHSWDCSLTVAWPFFYGLVAHTWRRRLPIEGEELATLLVHHGLPESCRPEIVSVFTHCRDALVLIVGRRSIKKRRADYVRRRTRPVRGPKGK
jgi:hypothetical protein